VRLLFDEQLAEDLCQLLRSEIQRFVDQEESTFFELGLAP